ncbi:MAG: UDP-glucose--hexose-1-phosphate uridylyltransferase [Ruminococcaceae bacterium]|nr:UDP-glucose--hexose-1-phosphate uridylyltransferase [Oscillospiraceae bacterium]
MEISALIKQLIDYAVGHELIEDSDRVYMTNRIMEELSESEYNEPESTEPAELEEILGAICDYAAEKGIIPENTTTYRDLFDTKLMGILTPRPSEVIKRFSANYAISPKAATDYYYSLSRNSDYIRTYRVKKDLKWTTESEYGDIDITVNLSKPEKDPKAIAAAKLLPQGGYPKCLLCRENEGYAGSAAKPARQNHRIIPITIAGKQWYLQYSPYVYYNEHCIAFNGEHTPMKIDRSAFEKILDFVEIFPHYFLGSNADLPIVGGSILSHDHMQGGCYSFAMEKAPVEKKIVFKGFEDIEAGIVKWPMSVIRISGGSKERLSELADKILGVWRRYSDESAFIFSETDGEPHNTVTPIARRRGELFELDIVLRNNITTDEHPLGVFHPHAELHNIKKENIGLIEVMGLAVLPSRLKEEIGLMKEYILGKKDFSENEKIAKHKAWFEKFADKYEFTEENTEEIIKCEIGRTFVKVLEDAGVYKRDAEGAKAFERFIERINLE